MKDSDIISQAVLGNKGAYRELLRKYANLSLAVAYARSGDREIARLASADAFVEASKELSELPESAPIAPWIASITRATSAKRMAGRRRASLSADAAKEKVQKALSKIDDGSFGVCEECGASISPKRLDARPEATLCIRCKEDQERVEKDFG